MKRKAEVIAASAKLQRRDVGKTHRARLSKFENLPVEVLQDIIIWSGNLGLAYCSHSLQRSLTSERVIVDTAVRAFYDAVDLDRDGYLRTVEPIKLAMARRSLSWLINCTLFGLPVLLKIADELQKRVLMEVNSRKLIKRFRRACIAGHNVKGYTAYEYDIPLLHKVEERLSIFRHYWLIIMPRDATKPCRIPRRLLIGPWAEDDIFELKVFRSLQPYWLGPTDDETDKTVVRGMMNAIKTGSLEVLRILLGLGDWMYPMLHSRSWMPQLISYTIRHCSDRRDILSLLIRCAHISCQDEVWRHTGASPARANPFPHIISKEVWDWLDQRYNKGHRDARWLYDLIQSFDSELGTIDASALDDIQSVYLSHTQTPLPLGSKF